MHARISTFTAIHFVVAREQPDVTTPHKLNQSKYFRLSAKGPLFYKEQNNCVWKESKRSLVKDRLFHISHLKIIASLLVPM